MRDLCMAFFQTGLLAFGGGFATFPFLEQMAREYGWFTMPELLNMIAVAESTPGPIGINTATYAGFQVAGVLGAVCATVSIVLPSLIVLILVARMLKQFEQNPLVQHAFYGLRPVSAGMVLGALGSVFVGLFWDESKWTGLHSLVSALRLSHLVLFVLFWVLAGWKPKVHPLVWIACGGVLGVVLQLG